MSKSFPKSETYSLTDQMRRSSRSIGAQIAEAWGKRRYEKHLVSKLTDADAEQLETQRWIDCAMDCGYVDASFAAEVNAKLTEIGRMLSSMIGKAELFCTSDAGTLRDPPAEYLVTSDQQPIASKELSQYWLLPLSTGYWILDTGY